MGIGKVKSASFPAGPQRVAQVGRRAPLTANLAAVLADYVPSEQRLNELEIQYSADGWYAAERAAAGDAVIRLVSASGSDEVARYLAIYLEAVTLGAKDGTADLTIEGRIATPSTVTLAITCDAATTIPAGTGYGDGTREWETDAETVVEEAGVVNVAATCTTNGTSTNVDADTITTIIDAVAEVSAVNNPAAASGAVDATVIPAATQVTGPLGWIFETDAEATVEQDGDVVVASTCIQRGCPQLDAGALNAFVSAAPDGATSVTSAQSVAATAESEIDASELAAPITVQMSAWIADTQRWVRIDSLTWDDEGGQIWVIDGPPGCTHMQPLVTGLAEGQAIRICVIPTN